MSELQTTNLLLQQKPACCTSAYGTVGSVISLVTSLPLRSRFPGHRRNMKLSQPLHSTDEIKATCPRSRHQSELDAHLGCPFPEAPPINVSPKIVPAPLPQLASVRESLCTFCLFSGSPRRRCTHRGAPPQWEGEMQMQIWGLGHEMRHVLSSLTYRVFTHCARGFPDVIGPTPGEGTLRWPLGPNLRGTEGTYYIFV